MKSGKITKTNFSNGFLNIIDKIIKEPESGAQNDFSAVIAELKQYIITSINDLKKLSKEELIENRYQKFRMMGK